MVNLAKVRPLLTLSHRGYENSPLLIVFSANYFDQSNLDFYATEGISESFDLLIWVDYMPRHENVTTKQLSSSSIILLSDCSMVVVVFIN